MKKVEYSNPYQFAKISDEMKFQRTEWWQTKKYILYKNKTENYGQVEVL